MESLGLDMEAMCSLFQNLPREYVVSAMKMCTNANYDSIMDRLINANDLYQQCLFGEKHKVYECILRVCHIDKCPFYHSASDRRRDPSKFAYEPKACFAICKGGIWDDRAYCNKGDNCPYAHSHTEMKMHPKHYQPTLKPVEEAKREEKQEISVQLLTDEINKSKSEIRVLEKDIEEKWRNLEKEKDEVEELKELVVCHACRNNIFSWAIVPCGHLVCGDCKRIVEKYCPVCKIEPKGFVEVR